MGRCVLLVLVCLVVASRAQDTYHEALLQYFEQEERLERGSGSGPGDVDEETEDVVPPTRIVRCLRCSEEEGDPDACIPTNLRRDLHEFIVECTGHCLNISAGDRQVYGCADERHGRTDRCITRVDTKICVCSNDLCNGPAEIFAEEAGDDFYEVNTQPPYLKDSVLQHSRGNSCSLNSVSSYILSFFLFIAFSQNVNLRFISPFCK